MKIADWIAVIGLVGAAFAWLTALTFRLGRRDSNISGAIAELRATQQRQGDGLGKKARGTLSILAQWEDLDEKERRRRAVELLEGK